MTSIQQTHALNVELKCPYTMLVSGPSSCGKTSFVLKLLENKRIIYNQTPGKTFWFYKVYQNSYDKAKQNGLISEFVQGMCTMNWLDENRVPPNSTIIIDDMALEADEDTAKLFTVGSHHYNVNVIFICQNLFTKNKAFRDISLNSTYLVLFKNVRDKQQISNFAKQYAPGRNKQFVQLFTEATQQPHSYILIDNHQETFDELRILSNYLGENNEPISVWILNK